MATTTPHLEPDPFDETIKDMLRDPALITDLDEQRAKLAHGELKVVSHLDVGERLRARGIPLLDGPSADS
jgi:hypothetical protein